MTPFHSGVTHLQVTHVLPGMQNSPIPATQATQQSTDVVLTYWIQPLFHDELTGEDQLQDIS